MHIEQHNNEKNGYFRAVENGQTAGQMTYRWANPHKLIIDHTEVHEAFRGQKVGDQLVMAAVEYARAAQVKILPLCPFAKKVFERKPEIGDVLA
jgi:predicted GNAT family acetyltransferase